MRIVILIFGISTSAAAALFVSSPGPVHSNPGLWTVEAQVEKYEATGVPDDVAEAVKAKLLGPYLHGEGEACVSEERARKTVTLDDLKLDGFDEAECRFDRTEVAGSRIDVAGSCTGEWPRTVTVTGTRAPDSLELLVKFDHQAPADGMRVQSQIRIKARRTGPCAPVPEWGSATAPSESDIAAAREAAMEAADAAAESADEDLSGY
jgi:hypothetical protein